MSTFKAFEDHLREDGKSEKTIESYIGDLRCLEAFLQERDKELVHDNMGEDYLTYDFTEIGKIAILEIADNINHLPEIGFYAVTMPLLDKIVEAVDDILVDGINYYRVTILLNDAEGVVLYLESKVHGNEVEEWIKQGKEDMICNGLS